MKTQQQIVERIKEFEEDRRLDFFGTKYEDLVQFLDFENAKPFLSEETTPEKWAEVQKPLTEARVIQSIREYMPFAWGKANDCRGLSAARSLHHMEAWLWLLDVDFDSENYNYYGKGKLVEICERPGIDVDWEDLDDDRWTDDEMSPGVTAAEALRRI